MHLYMWHEYKLFLFPLISAAPIQHLAPNYCPHNFYVSTPLSLSASLVYSRLSNSLTSYYTLCPVYGLSIPPFLPLCYHTNLHPPPLTLLLSTPSLFSKLTSASSHIWCNYHYTLWFLNLIIVSFSPVSRSALGIPLGTSLLDSGWGPGAVYMCSNALLW